MGKPKIEYKGVFENTKNLLEISWTKEQDLVKILGNEIMVPVNIMQSPVTFWEDLIQSVPNSNLVLDLFAGTGSVTEAALRQQK